MSSVIAEYAMVDDEDGKLWISVSVDRTPHDRIGPFETAAEREHAMDELLDMMREAGAIDLPLRPQ